MRRASHTVYLSDLNWVWLAERARAERRTVSCSLDLLVDLLRARERPGADRAPAPRGSDDPDGLVADLVDWADPGIDVAARVRTRARIRSVRRPTRRRDPRS